MEHTPEYLAEQNEVLKNDLANYIWLKERERWASVMTDFDNTHTYKQHRVVWFLKGHGWLEAKGQSFDEAVENARFTKVNADGESYVERTGRN